ncbi:Clp protease [Rhizobium sp. 58]|nr:Clp protease [Rhizobium sp. 58]
MNSATSAALDPTPLISWIVAAMTIINFIILMKGLLSAGEKKLEERIAKLEAKVVEPSAVSKLESKVVEHDRRIQSVEGDMKHLPNQETMHSIELTMLKIVGRLDKQDATLEGRFSAMDERLKPIHAIGERLNDVLVDQMKRAV